MAKILKNKKCKKLMAGLLAILMLPLVILQSGATSASPLGKNSEKAITIGYCGEEYTTFTLIMSGVCNTLYENGMLKKEPPKEFFSAEACWDFISENTNDRENVIFDKNSFYNITKMTDKEQHEVVSEHKADLMIVMGSIAAKLFLNSGYEGDYIVAGTNNAYGLGVVKSARDSGRDNRCAAIYDDVYTKQVQSVCQMVDFKHLGVVYDDSETAFEYSGVGELRKQASKKDFELMEKILREPLNAEDYPRYIEQIKKLYQEMAQHVDAFYLTINQIHDEDLPQALKPFYDRGIPVISQQGSREVKNGALFGISMTDERNYGALLMDMITDYLSGQPLRYMSRVFHSSPKISFNLSVAKKIHFPLDIRTMLVCDDIY
ncbi:MAG: ABC transporter substrate binding protein [Oscillospiraceae bacterium]